MTKVLTLGTFSRADVKFEPVFKSEYPLNVLNIEIRYAQFECRVREETYYKIFLSDKKEFIINNEGLELWQRSFLIN
jgi:hypothetical protein